MAEAAQAFRDLVSLALSMEDDDKQKEMIIVALTLVGEAVISISESLEKLADCVSPPNSTDAASEFNVAN